MLISGTRDLLLSQVVLMHLVEGASHFTYFIEPFAEESHDFFAEMARFLDTHLGS